MSPESRMAEMVQQYYVRHPEMIERLLERIGGEQIHHDYGHEVRSCCPLHGGQNKDNFVIYYDRGYPAWRCFSDQCGKGNLVTLLMKKYKASFPQAVVSLGRLAGLQVEGMTINIPRQTIEEESMAAFKRRMGIVTSVDERPVLFPESMVRSSMEALYFPQSKVFLDFMTNAPDVLSPWGERCRGFSIDVLQHWQAGFVPGKQWVTTDPSSGDKAGWFESRISVPWRTTDGLCMGFAGRRVDGNPSRKWKTFPGTKRALSLYGLSDPMCQTAIRGTQVLHIVEGYTDVWRAHQHGYYNTVAVGGTALTEQQKQLLAPFAIRYVVLFMDGDGPGIVAVQGLGKQLSKLANVVVATPPVDKDPGDLVSYSEFCTPIVQARPFISQE